MNNLNVSLENGLYTKEVPAFVIFEEINGSDLALEILGVKVSDKEPIIKSVESLGASVPEAVKLPEPLFTTVLIESVVEHLAVEEPVANPFLEDLKDLGIGDSTEWQETAQNLAEQAIKEEERKNTFSSSSSYPASSSSPSPVSTPKKKRRPSASARARARQKASQSASSSTTSIEPAQQVPSNLAIRKFVVQQSMGGNYDISLSDSTKIAEDLSRDLPHEAGEKHLFKRLNANYAMATFVEQNQEGLKGYTFNVVPFTGIFRATDYVIPSGYDHKPNKGLQRIHISMFPTFAMLNNKKEYYQMGGKILVNGQEHIIKNFLNLCDIGPELLNDVDGYIELKGRMPLRALLEEVRKGSKDALTNATEFAQHYQALLNDLKQDVENGVTVAPRKSPTRTFEGPLLVKFADKAHKAQVLGYIQGMSQAISRFVKEIDLARNEEPSALYAIG